MGLASPPRQPFETTRANPVSPCQVFARGGCLTEILHQGCRRRGVGDGVKRIFAARANPHCRAVVAGKIYGERAQTFDRAIGLPEFPIRGTKPNILADTSPGNIQANMELDCYEPYGLTPMRLGDQALFRSAFLTASDPLSDYSFASMYMWRDAIGLRWRILHDMVCLFANGTGGLTLICPPMGEGDFAAAVDEAVDLCRQVNLDRGWNGDAAIEYVSSGLREKFPTGFAPEPLSGDYVYPTRQLAELSLPELHSKRRACRKFLARYDGRCVALAPQHLGACEALLEKWHGQHHDGDDEAGHVIHDKRTKDLDATRHALREYEALQLEGMVLLVGDKPVGFTLGEQLWPDMCSILIEKTDRSLVGSGAFIYREFCRLRWPHVTWCNAGDDWGIPSLAWNKQSYQPAFRQLKWRMVPPAPVPGVRVPAQSFAIATRNETPVDAAPARPMAASPVFCAAGHVVEHADLADLPALVALENACFPPDQTFDRSHLRHMIRSPRTVVFVIRHDGPAVADAILLQRTTPAGPVSRLYSLAVSPDCRGQGMGAALLDACLDHVRRTGSRHATLEVDQANAPAIRLYLSRGFTLGRVLPDYYGPGVHGWKMHWNAPAEMAAATPDHALAPA